MYVSVVSSPIDRALQTTTKISIDQSIELFVQKCNKHWTGHQKKINMQSHFTMGEYVMGHGWWDEMG